MQDHIRRWMFMILIALSTAARAEGQDTATTRPRGSNSPWRLGFWFAPWRHPERVDSAALAAARQTNIVSALAGRAAGAEVVQQSGEAGAPAWLSLRGFRTLTGDGQPLYVVDGLPVNNFTL